MEQEKYVENIFRPITNKDGKFKKWIKHKMLHYVMGEDQFKKRFTQVHVIAKNKVFKVIMKKFVRVLGDFMIQDIKDIPAQWYNNHMRIFYDSWIKGLDDMFTELIYKLDRPETKGFMDSKEYLAWVKNSRYWSHENRKTMINVWATEIMEDTADREWLNFFMLRMMNDFYKGNVPKPGEYPIYTSRFSNSREYFNENKGKPVWHPEEEKK